MLAVRRLTAVLSALLLLMVPLAGIATGQDPISADLAKVKVHPVLVQFANESPDAPLTVIVQMNKGHRLSASDLPKGSVRKKELAFTDAQVITLPAKEVIKLARHPHVRFLSPDAAMRPTLTETSLATTYPGTLGLPGGFWLGESRGQGIGVAVLDSGISVHPDLRGTQQALVVQGAALGTSDAYGHGTHVAGIINGSSQDGRFQGVAPKSQLYNIKVSDNAGMARESDLLAGMQWVFENHATYNIRVVNISMTSSLAQSYMTAPLSAGVEELWLKGIVVVVAAGNRGSAPDALFYPPANDPFVITVGASNDNGTTDRADDAQPDWSGRGSTQDGFAKPDVLAPGSRIVSTLAVGSYLAAALPDRITDGQYLRLSGTSMSAPMVSGLVADMLSYQPLLSPNQVKWVLTTQAYGPAMVDGMRVYGYLQVTPVVADIPAANGGLALNQHLAAMGQAAYENMFFENMFFENMFFENMFFESTFLD